MQKTVLITGASSGIGEALAREFSAKGYSCGLLARRVDRLESLKKEIEARGGDVAIFEGDVTKDADVQNAAKEMISRWKKLDVVVANAGFGVSGSVEKLDLEDYRRQVETNIFGLIRTVKETLPFLLESRGRLALIGSVAGHVGLPGMSAYAMSKAAVSSFSNAIHFDLFRKGVKVTLISPGFVDSEIRKVDNKGVLRSKNRDPIPSYLRMPSDVAAKKIVRAIEKGKKEEVITAHGKFIVWVHRHFPWLTDFVVKRAGLKGRPEPRKLTSD